MANPFQQLAQQRKLVYAVLILALFTVSLVQRKLLIEPEALNLQLREIARGEVELTSSAVRLTLTGSRGLAVTFLWSAAMKKQEKHDYNEVELLVSSITKLQPYFITPWIFQSWNMAFNVAVECDRPIDKYYYVSRGMELLAEGERRNQGGAAGIAKKFPGNPEMRHHMGMTYQLKLGSSDEKYTMRSLLELSCIDPAERDPELMRDLDRNPQSRSELEKFCRKNPRLVRRLREHLSYEKEKQLVDFLVAARDIPSRFQKRGPREQVQTPLKPPAEQFPVLPNYREEGWPDAASHDLVRKDDESINVYLMSRTWFQYSQKPLPPHPREFRGYDYDPLQYRLPRQMAVILFRGTPPRSQAFIAETLEEEGWFDDEGWAVPDWFDRRDGDNTSLEPVVVGREKKYHAGPQWNKAFEMYREYGIDTGMLITDRARQQYEELAKPFRLEEKLEPGQKARDNLPSDKKTKGYYAHELLVWSAHNRGLTNFDAHYYEAEAERTPLAVRAQKLYFKALKALRDSPTLAIGLFEEALPLWMDVLLEFPEYGRIGTTQEETYERELKYMRRVQNDHQKHFEDAVLSAWEVSPIPFGPFTPMPGAVVKFKSAEGRAEFAAWPFVPWHLLLSENERKRIIPIRTIRGPFDITQTYDVPHAGELKEALLAWTQGASLGYPMAFPGQKNLLLTRRVLGGTVEVPNWRFLVDETNIRIVRDRMGLNR